MFCFSVLSTRLSTWVNRSPSDFLLTPRNVSREVKTIPISMRIPRTTGSVIRSGIIIFLFFWGNKGKPIPDLLPALYASRWSVRQYQKCWGNLLKDKKITDLVTSRRSVVKASAWSTPIVALSVAVPVLAVSGDKIDVGAYTINATCTKDDLRGFAISLRPSANSTLPIGTTILVTSDNWAGTRPVWFPTYIDYSEVSRSVYLFTVWKEMPIASHATFFIYGDPASTTAFYATVTLPAGYVGTDAKSTAVMSFSDSVCSVA